jgi:RND superfamily putative drug exporter
VAYIPSGALWVPDRLVLATFAAMASLPLVFAAELGFAVAFGVLLDTMIVRSVLVTAPTLDVGRWMWWPGRLSRRHDDPQPPAGEPDLEPALRVM